MKKNFWFMGDKMMGRVNEELLVTDFNNTDDPLAIYDEAFHLIRVNSAFAEIFQTSPRHLVGETCYKSIYKRSSRCELCQAGEVFRIAKPQIWEEKRRLPDGTLRYFEVFTSPILGHRGPKTLAVMCRHDISKQKRIASQWKNSEKKHRTILEMAREGIFVMDIEARLTYANRRLLEMLEYTEEEIIGRSIFDFMCKDTLSKAKIGWTAEGLVDINEMCFARKDGRRLVAQMSFSSVRDETGFVDTVGTVTDVTQLKKVEEKLRSAKEFSEKIVNSITDSIIIIDPKTYKIIQVNDHFLQRSDLDSSYVLSKTCYEIRHGRTSPCEVYGLKCPVREAAINRESAFIDRAFRDADGSKKIVHIFTYPILDNNKEVSLVLLIEHDVTVQRKMEENLKDRTLEVEKAHGQLKTLFEISGQLTSMGSLAELVNYILETSHRIFTNSESILFLLNAERNNFFLIDIDVMDPRWAGPLHRMQQKIMEKELFKEFIHYLRNISAAKIITSKHPDIPETIGFFSDMYSNWFGMPIMTQKDCVGFFFVGSGQQQECNQDDQRFLHTLISQVSGHIRFLVVHESEIRKLRQQVQERSSYGKIIGMSSAMQKVYDMIDLVSGSDATILITGESGTGKELVAQAIHRKGDRRDNPFVVAHCAGFSPSLMESELFGHEKGAFTGAIDVKKGRIERAHGGTLFFDEIGEISTATQVLLLRFLQNHRFERVGGEKAIDADVRVIAATNRDLQHEISAGRFRKDLYYRLNVILITLPPLRLRKVDIPMLTKHFLEKYSFSDRGGSVEMSSEAMSILIDYNWPGNVRQLENAVNHAIVIANGKIIEEKHLPKFAPYEKSPPPFGSLAENEKQLIDRVLNDSRWNKHQAAKRLKISRSTLYSKINRYKLQPQSKNVRYLDI